MKASVSTNGVLAPRMDDWRELEGSGLGAWLLGRSGGADALPLLRAQSRRPALADIIGARRM
jgi:hypothetical protein